MAGDQAHPGIVVVENNYRFLKKHLLAQPFCQFCRKTKEVVLELSRPPTGNPVFICRDCLEEHLEAFGKLV